MAYEVVMPYHLHMPSYFLETFTEYPKADVFRFFTGDDKMRGLSRFLRGLLLNQRR